MFARGSFYTEFRNNGTPVQTNDTRMGEGAVGLDQQFGSADSLTFRAHGLVLGYDQRFSSVAANRNSESLTDIQYVPEQVVGGAAQWTHFLGKHKTLIAGMDLMEVMGASDEQLFLSGTHHAKTTLRGDGSASLDGSGKISSAGTVGQSFSPDGSTTGTISTRVRSVRRFLAHARLRACCTRREATLLSARASLGSAFFGPQCLRHGIYVSCFTRANAERVIPQFPSSKCSNPQQPISKRRTADRSRGRSQRQHAATQARSPRNIFLERYRGSGSKMLRPTRHLPRSCGRKRI